MALQLDPDDRNITVAHAEFAHCQHGLACILAQGRGLVIDHVRFHDVRDADVIRGAADDVTISDSDLHDALAGTHADNHNDLIQILGGGPWTIVRSHFGRALQRRRAGLRRPALGPRRRTCTTCTSSRACSRARTRTCSSRSTCASPRSRPFRWRPASSSSTTRSSRPTIAAIVLADEYSKVAADKRPLVQNNILEPPEALALRRGAHGHERDRHRADPARAIAAARRSSTRKGRPQPRRRRIAAAPRHLRAERRRPTCTAASAAIRPRSAPSSCADEVTRRDRLRSGAMEISSGVRVLTLDGDVHDRARLDRHRSRSCGPRSRTTATSVAARAPPTTATASPSAAARAFIESAGDALGDDPFALEAIEHAAARARRLGRRLLRGRMRAARSRRQARRAADLEAARPGRPHAADLVHDRHRLDRGHGRPRTARGRGGLPAAQGEARRRGRPRTAGGDQSRLRSAVAGRRQRGLDRSRRRVSCCRRWSGSNVELIEQPFPAGEHDAFRELRAAGQWHPAGRRRGLPHAPRRRRGRQLRRRGQPQARQDGRHPRGRPHDPRRPRARSRRHARLHDRELARHLGGGPVRVPLRLRRPRRPSAHLRRPRRGAHARGRAHRALARPGLGVEPLA